MPNRDVLRCVLGIAGLPGAGKGEVSRWFEDWGAERIDADSLGHALLANDSPLKPALVQRFGNEILDESGGICRRALGRIVFADAQALNDLNQIVHPVLVDRIKKLIAGYRNDAAVRARMLVVDAALIPEWGLESELDELLIVSAPRELRAERLKTSRGWSDEDFQRREDAQWSDEQKQLRATKVLHNRGRLEELGRELQVLLPDLLHAERGEDPEKKNPR